MRFYACLKPDEHHASNGWQHARSQKDINKIAKQRQAESSHYYIILYRNAFMIKQMLKAGTPAPAAAAYGRTINRLATLT